MMSVEERVRAAAHARASLVRDIPPLRLPDELTRPRQARNRRLVTWGAPLVAAAAVLALVVSQVMLRHAVGPHSGGTSPGSSGPVGAAALPRYFAAVEDTGTTGQLVVGDDHAGRVLKVVKQAGLDYVGVSGAADDRTWVAAVVSTKTKQPTFQKVSVSGTQVRISPLAIPSPSDQSYQFALSSDGRELAVLSGNNFAELWVYTLSDGGLVGHWKKGPAQQVSGLAGFQGSRVLFAAYGPGASGYKVYQFRALDVRAPGRGLIADSTVTQQEPADVKQGSTTIDSCRSWVYTPDGVLVCGSYVGTENRKPVPAGLGPAVTGDVPASGKLLYRDPAGQYTSGGAEIFWASAGARAVLVQLSVETPPGKTQYRFGLVSGGRFTPLSHLGFGPSVVEPEDLAFLSNRPLVQGNGRDLGQQGVLPGLGQEGRPHPVPGQPGPVNPRSRPPGRAPEDSRLR
jgi:hypothetical protein